MIYKNYSCISCLHIITNPMCPNCFSKHVTLWIRDKNLPQYQASRIKKLLRRLVMKSESMPSDTRCVICNTKAVNLCTYCLTNEASQIIKNSLKDNNILEKFDEDFNTNILEIA